MANQPNRIWEVWEIPRLKEELEKMQKVKLTVVTGTLNAVTPKGSARLEWPYSYQLASLVRTCVWSFLTWTLSLISLVGLGPATVWWRHPGEAYHIALLHWGRPFFAESWNPTPGTQEHFIFPLKKMSLHLTIKSLNVVRFFLFLFEQGK